MITFVINFPTPVAAICPLLYTILLKEKKYSVPRGGFSILSLFYAPLDWIYWFLEILTHALEEQDHDFENTPTGVVSFH